MAAGKWQVYHEAKVYIAGADADLNGALRMKLVKAGDAASVSNFAISTFASIPGATTNLKTTTMKTPGNISLRLSSNSILCFDSAAVVFTASGGTCTSVQYAAIGISNGKAVAWCKLSTAAFDITSTLTVTPAANGYFTISGGTAAS